MVLSSVDAIVEDVRTIFEQENDATIYIPSLLINQNGTYSEKNKQLAIIDKIKVIK